MKMGSDGPFTWMKARDTKDHQDKMEHRCLYFYQDSNHNNKNKGTISKYNEYQQIKQVRHKDNKEVLHQVLTVVITTTIQPQTIRITRYIRTIAHANTHTTVNTGKITKEPQAKYIHKQCDPTIISTQQTQSATAYLPPLTWLCHYRLRNSGYPLTRYLLPHREDIHQHLRFLYYRRHFMEPTKKNVRAR